MFTILAGSPLDMLDAMFILSHYQVKFQAFSDAENPLSTEIVVDEEIREGDLNLAEMAFQMNYRQVGYICPFCVREDPEAKTCGHLTFKGRLSDDIDLGMFSFLPEEKNDPVYFKAEALESIPPKANPMHHDLFSMGVRINDRVFATHTDRNFVDLTDMMCGTRVRITFPG